MNDDCSEDSAAVSGRCVGCVGCVGLRGAVGQVGKHA